MIDILIPHLGLNADINQKARACMESIVRCSTSDDYRVILIDNGSIYPIDPCQYFGEDRCVWIRNKQNAGFVGAMNQGLAVSDAQFIIALNNDTEVAPNWLQLLRQPFLEDPSVAICSPLTTDEGWQGRYARDNPTAAGWVALPPGKMVAFFCAMISRKFLDDVGFRHEAFEDFGGFGGDDYLCEVACKFGYHIALQRDLIIKHHRRTTFKALHSQEEIASMQTAALARFRELKGKP